MQNFNAEDFLDRKARKMDRYAQYAMVSSEEAINDAAFNFENLIKTEQELFGDQEWWLETFQIEMLNYSAGDGTPNSILSLYQK
jgi:3-oxoacyl-[acyl-carrier-protein] synthase II